MVSGEGGTFAPPSMLMSLLGHFLALQQCHSFWQQVVPWSNVFSNWTHHLFVLLFDFIVGLYLVMLRYVF